MEKNLLLLTVFYTWCFANSDGSLHEKLGYRLAQFQLDGFLVLFFITIVLHCTEVLSLAQLSKAICFSNLFYVSRVRKKNYVVFKQLKI